MGGMIAGSFASLVLAALSVMIETFVFISTIWLFISLFLLSGFYFFRVKMSPINIDETGIWNDFQGSEKNYCRWSDVIRVIRRLEWSLFLGVKTETWILIADSEGKKTKLSFDNNLDGYEELSLLVAEQVQRRGIRIETG